MFRSRTHMGCDYLALRLWIPMHKFQSTHPHGVRQAPIREHSRKPDVSSHAPARGATFTSCHRFLKTFIVSIHAPARGATKKSINSSSPKKCFNPRTRTGCDQLLLFPTRSYLRFNPRTRTGCDSDSDCQGGEG